MQEQGGVRARVAATSPAMTCAIRARADRGTGDRSDGAARRSGAATFCPARRRGTGLVRRAEEGTVATESELSSERHPIERLAGPVRAVELDGPAASSAR